MPVTSADGAGPVLSHMLERLEESDLPVGQVATRSGFGRAALLRHHFQACTGISATACRSQHRAPAMTGA